MMKALFPVMVLAVALTSFGAQARGGGCKKIEKACKSAGHKKKKDCYDKILAGESIDGVAPAQSDVDSCKAKKHH
jgi:hypothetical protein